jgi:hypothetical protein
MSQESKGRRKEARASLAASSKVRGMGEPEPSLWVFLRWCREVGLVAILFGGGSMMISYFWAGVVLIYAGFILLAVDIRFNPALGRSPILRYGLLGVVAAFAVGFSFAFVFVSAPLGIEALGLSADFPSRTMIAGIPWSSQFSELHVVIANPTIRNYEDLDVAIIELCKSNRKLGQKKRGQL